MSSKYTKQKNASCFSGFLQRFICTGNLPTHPTPPDQTPTKPPSFPCPLITCDDGTNNSTVVAVNTNSPGIIAKLMGLDSLPSYPNITSLDSLFRSKSLNSLHFLPDFDPTRAAFHRRARTSASFHDQGKQYHHFLDKIDENLEMRNEVVVKEKNECKRNNTSTISCSRRNKEVKNNCVGANSGVSNSNNDNLREKCRMQNRKLINNKENNNSGKVGSTISSKKNKVDHKEVMCIEVQSDDLQRSPVSVLDHHAKEISPFSKGKGRKTPSKTRKKSSPKLKFYDNPLKDMELKTKETYDGRCNEFASKREMVKAEVEVEVEVEATDYLIEVLAYVCKLAEEQISDSKWAAKYGLLKEHFVKDLSTHLGQEILDLMLDELLDEVIMSL